MAWADEIAIERRAWLVTGAAGFIGSHLVSSLLALEQDVVGLDNLSTGYASNLDSVASEVGPDRWRSFRFIEGDVRDYPTCVEAVADTEYVLHQAALGSVPRSIEDPRTTHTVNVDGTVNVFLAALGGDVRKVVYASSSSVYGDSPQLPKVEASTGRPLSPYAAGKQTCELYAETLSRTHGLPAVGLRYFNVVGARQDPNGPYAAVAPRWIAAMRAGTNPVIYGDGETSRDFCPVANVVQINLRAALSGPETNGAVYNVALGRQTTLNELSETLREALGAAGYDTAAIAPQYEDFRPGDIRHSLADISKAVHDLGYAPEVDLAEGLAAAVRG